MRSGVKATMTLGGGGTEPASSGGVLVADVMTQALARNMLSGGNGNCPGTTAARRLKGEQA